MEMRHLVWTLAWLFFGPVLAQGEFEEGEFANFEGVRIYYTDSGAGAKTLVFVHGWACDGDFWKESRREFPDYRVIVIDLPGHGRSDKPAADYTGEYFARSVHAVMQDEGIKDAVLIGHSMGAHVIQEFYHLYPEQTLGLAIVDGPLWPIGTEEEREQRIAPFRADYRTAAAQAVDAMLQPVLDEELKRGIRSAMLATPEHVGLSAVVEAADESTWTRDRIDVPVLAILAEARWWKPDPETALRAIAPDLDFQMWRGVSHFLMLEQPARFNQALKKFLSKHDLG